MRKILFLMVFIFSAGIMSAQDGKVMLKAGTQIPLGSADFSGWWQWIIMNKVVPLPYGTDQATTCHPSGCAYRQLRCCKL